MALPHVLASHGAADIHVDGTMVAVGVVLLVAAGGGFWFWWRKSHPR